MLTDMVPRRALLRAVGIAITAGAAGCNTLVGGDSNDTPTTEPQPSETPETTLTPTPTPTPDDGTETPIPVRNERVGTPSLTAGQDSSIDDFGRAVALSEETAVVVSAGHGAYVFESGDGWRDPAVLTPTDNEHVGGHDPSTAVVDGTILVGGPSAGADSNSGAVYRYDRTGDGWTQRHRFALEDDGEPDAFGKSVAFDGDRVLVGEAHDPETMVPWIGGAHVYRGSGAEWTKEAELGTEASDLFGTAVDIDGDRLLVGAPFATVDDRRRGAVYAFRRNGVEWIQDGRLVPDLGAQVIRFGQSVAIDGQTALVGAPGGARGRAFLWELTDDGWVQQARLVVPAGGPNTEFGQAVALRDGIAVVGAPDAFESGTAYVFRAADDWAEATRLYSATNPADAEFGDAISLSATQALVGAPALRTPTSAYLFDV